MNNRHPFPRRYWIFVLIVVCCCLLLVGNIFRTDDWTREKPFSEFTDRDGLLFKVFIFEELLILLVILIFLCLIIKTSKKRNRIIEEQREKDKFLGIKPGDYDYVWFDFTCGSRALIVKHKDTYRLFVEDYDERYNTWTLVNHVSVYDSMQELKKGLFYDYEFYCSENAELDNLYGERFKEE